MKKLIRFFLAFALLAMLVYIGIHLSGPDAPSANPVEKAKTEQISKPDLNHPPQDQIQSQAETINKQTENPPELLVDEDQSLLQTALAGELTALIDFQIKMTRCRNKSRLVETAREQTEEIRENIIDKRISKMVNSDYFVRSAEKTKDMCDQFYQQLNADQAENITDEETNLRVLSSIIAEADTGNPMARLLYALWAPTERQSFLVGTALLEYEQLAMEYTLLNKEKHPQLALFALGRSYTGQGYFTPEHQTLGGAYLIASGICGLESPMLNMFQAAVISRVQAGHIPSGSGKTTEKELNEQARNIANEFCPDFLRDSTPGLH